MSAIRAITRFGLTRTSPAAGNGPDGTENYVEVVIQSSQVGSALTDYPVYVDLSTLPAAFFTNVQADGGDIRVTESDGTTRAPVDLVSIDTGGSAGELHFLASSVSASSNTTYRVYYNATSTLSQPAAGDTYGRNAVWTDYTGVWHLQEDPSGTAPQMVDSTGNGHDGATAGSMASGDSVTGQLGQGLDLDGTDDRVNTGSYLLGIETGFQITAWAKTGTVGSDHEQIMAAHDFGGERVIQFRINGTVSGVDGTLRLIRFDASNNVIQLTSSGRVDDSAWRKLTAVFDNSSGSTLYVDGSSDGSDADTTNSYDNVSPDLILGAIEGDGTFQDFLVGSLDEARIRAAPVSADWEAAEHTNQSTPGTFYTVGTEQPA